MERTTNASSRAMDEFSLVVGGPVYNLFIRAHLLKPSMDLVHRRIIACLVVTFLPLVLLTLLERTFSGGVPVPFLFDLANIRFLITLPLLIGAELIVHRRFRIIVAQFQERELILPVDQPRFQALIVTAMRLRNSIVVELLLLVLSFIGGYWLWIKYGTLNVATWYAVPEGNSISLTYAGYWFAFISLPIARFILLRWYFRLFIWYLFLWRVSHMQLRLDPLHPDRAGGLGFLTNSIPAFAPVLVAQSCFFSALIGNQIIHQGAKLADFKIIIASFVVLLLLLVVFPLSFFVFQMVEARLEGSHEYGTLASRYVREFERKWLTDLQQPDEPLLGSSDIQSLADLANSFEVVRTMRVLPFDKAAVLRLAVFLIIPLLPLALTIFSIQEILERLIKLAI